MAIMLTIWRWLMWSIPVPLGLIIAAALWVQYDKSSAARKAVNRYVASAELAQAEDQIKAMAIMRQISEERVTEQQRLARELEEANRRFAVELEAKEEQIDDLLNTPAPLDCVLTPELRDRLRKALAE
jgi:predicted solute-binding protein